MGKELRYLSNIELRASSSKFELSGIAASYNSKSAPIAGQFVEKIAPGAFTRCLASSPDVRALFNHNPSAILGRTKNGTLQLEDSKDGLRFTVQLNKRTQLHNDVYEAIKRGDIDSCSFGFEVPDGGDEWGVDPEDRSRKLRTLRRVNLFDVSPVTYAAYPEGTQVSARAQDRDLASVGIYAARAIRSAAELRAECDRLGKIIAAGPKPGTDEWRRQEVDRISRLIEQER